MAMQNVMDTIKYLLRVFAIDLPIFDWLPKYTRGDFAKDAVAGCTVFALMIPQAMAYASLAGMPPIYGLYSSTFPLLLYAALGTSRHISIGPMAITCLLLSTTIHMEAPGLVEGSPDYINFCLSLSLVTALITWILGLFRLGFLTNFLSGSVLSGFITASACVIALSQLKYILGIRMPRFQYSHQTIIYLLTHLHESNPSACGIGFSSWLGLYYIKVWRQLYKKQGMNQTSAATAAVTNTSSSSNSSSSLSSSSLSVNSPLHSDPASLLPSTSTPISNQHPPPSSSSSFFSMSNLIPPTSRLCSSLYAASNLASLVAIIISAGISYAIIKGGMAGDLQVVGDVPQGFLAPGQMTLLPFMQLISLVPSAFLLAIIAFTGNWAVCVKYGTQFGYHVDATQELVATGLSNAIGVFFNCFFSSGGLARSAVNTESGAKTQISGVITAVGMIMAILFLTKLFKYIPMAILGAVIEVSVLSMMDFEAMKVAYQLDKRDFYVILVTFLMTFFVGISQGVFFGVALSLFVVLHAVAFPQIAHLGRMKSSPTHFRDIKRNRDCEQIPGIAIVRMDASLFFANRVYFQDTIMDAANGKFHSDKSTPIEHVIIDASAWHSTDLAGIQTLQAIQSELTGNRNITISFAGVKAGLRNKLLEAKFIDEISGDAMVFFSIDDALTALPGRLARRAMSRTMSMDETNVIYEPSVNYGATMGSSGTPGDMKVL